MFAPPIERALLVIVTDGAQARDALEARPHAAERVVLNNGGDFDVADVAFEHRARYVHYTFCADLSPVQWVLRLLVAAETLESPLVEVVVPGEFPQTFKTAHIRALAEGEWEDDLPADVEARHALEFLLLLNKQNH